MIAYISIEFGNGNFADGFPARLKLNQHGNRGLQLDGHLPGNSEMPHLLCQWQEAFKARLDKGTSRANKRNQSKNSSENAAKELEQQLNCWLNGDRAEWQPIRHAIAQHLNSTDDIRAIIITHHRQLRQLPWMAWDIFAQNQVEIALSGTTDRAIPPLPPPHRKRARILAVLGNSDNLDTDFDRQQIARLRNVGGKIEFLTRPSKEQLLHRLWSNQVTWDIFFFAGHSSSENGEIGWLEVNHREQLTIDHLKNALSHAIQGGLQIAIFNSCDGLGLAHQLAKLQLAQSIVMKEKVPDKVAKDFLEYFLTAFARGSSFYAALREARLKLKDFWQTEYPGIQWVPVIYQHPAMEPPTWGELRGRNQPIAVAPQPLAGGKWWELWRQFFARSDAPYRKDLLKKVNAEIESRLEQSLHGGLLTNVGKEHQLQQVKRQWDVEVKVGDRTPEMLPDWMDIVDVFDKESIGGKLLILGAPGSGKTTTLLELARELCDRAMKVATEPMPILLNLATWQEDTQGIGDWIAVELQNKYDIKPKLGKQWLKTGQLLPLLDGLDELESGRQEPGVRAINQFLHGEMRSPALVVCSRREAYERSDIQLHLNASICLHPLNHSQIKDYLQIVDREKIWPKIQGDRALFKLARVPLFLSAIALAYRHISLQHWQQLTTNESRQEYLLDTYIQQMLERPLKPLRFPHNRPPSAKQTRHFLIWLAKTLDRFSQTELANFAIEDMQPLLLPNLVNRRLYRFGVSAIYGLIAGGIISGIHALVFLGNHIQLSAIVWFFLLVVIALFYGFFFGLWVFLTFGKELHIKPVATLLQSKVKILKSIGVGLICGLISWPIVKVIFWILPGFAGLPLPYWIIPLMGPVFLLTFEITSPEIERPKHPNQGIKQSFKNALFFAVLGAISMGGIAFLARKHLFAMLFAQTEAISAVSLSLADTVQIVSIGMAIGLFLGLSPAGTACIQHFTLRLILYWKGYIPWNYARFLKYATQRMFLQEVGGRYRFIHKLLQEHFARMNLR
ncbi:CHAT domain-containing protein [Phormidium sp. CCY1219]|uniref:CHAT domain-containing protein n=1 Tax=Phormidium sp. CCY1219 TaxID=2886104 RepID=UPI002D1EBC32|nr:CHAT domain-containing protein [Phormidium sp. CCY1219]MEB3831069.1 CHAT domain-containing protein [Phormidium sp. CCY1219]